MPIKEFTFLAILLTTYSKSPDKNNAYVFLSDKIKFGS
jgi:hypothetical protein